MYLCVFPSSFQCYLACKLISFPCSIFQRKRPSKLSELESQISKLQDDLKKVKDQLVASESSKKEARKDAEESKRQLIDVSTKLEDSQKQLSKILASKEEYVVHLQKTFAEKEQEWEFEMECVRKQHSIGSVALAVALDEIQNLKLQLEKVNESGYTQLKQNDTAQSELKSLKDKLAETFSLLKNMKEELKESRESDTKAQELVKETLLQLEAAKELVDALRSDIVRTSDVYDSVASELEQARARVSFLEGVVKGLNTNLMKVSDDNCVDQTDDQILPENVGQLQVKLQIVQSDVRQLRCALEASEIRYNEERSHNTIQLENASELLEKINMQSSFREVKLEGDLKKANTKIEELKGNLMDKETKLQGISEENEKLNLKLKRSQRSAREKELKNELKKVRDQVADLRENLMDKENEVRSISEENEMLKCKISTQETEKAVENGEQESLTKLEKMMEEVDKSNKKAARVVEQLEAVRVANAEMKAELRILKIQSDQWRKAAEAAASMLSPGSNGTGLVPLGSKCSPVGGRRNSRYLDDYDDDSFKKKNGNVLKKFLWKKPQK